MSQEMNKVVIVVVILVTWVLLGLYVLTRTRRPTPTPIVPSRVCVVMYSTPDIVPMYSGIAAIVNREYARRHGYAFEHIVGSHTLPKPLVPAWNKVRVIRERLPFYDAVFFIDSDAVFNIQSKSLEEYLDMPEDLIGCSDSPQGQDAINGGAMLFKNTAWCRGFMDRWWDTRHIPRYAEKFTYEQGSMTYLIDREDLERKNKVRVLPAQEFNSSFHEIKAGRRDTFVLHFMMTKAETRKREITKIAHRLGLVPYGLDADGNEEGIIPDDPEEKHSKYRS